LSLGLHTWGLFEFQFIIGWKIPTLPSLHLANPLPFSPHNFFTCFLQILLPNGVLPTNLFKTCKILTNFSVSLSNFWWKIWNFSPILCLCCHPREGRNGVFIAPLFLIMLWPYFFFLFTIWVTLLLSFIIYFLINWILFLYKFILGVTIIFFKIYF
jgi:hypothetical protein